MNQNAFIAHVPPPSRAALQNAIIDQHPVKLRPILTDADVDVKDRADIRGACYSACTACTSKQWDYVAGMIDSMDLLGGVYAWQSGGNKNRQVRVVPGFGAVADVLDAPWLHAHLGMKPISMVYSAI